jgi:hypothetical protein
LQPEDDRRKIQRQIAVAVVITVKESPFLLAVQRVIGGVKVQDQKPRRLLRRAEKGAHEILFKLVHLSDDLLVTRSITQEAARGFKAVERALSAKACLDLSRCGGTFQILLATKKGQGSARRSHDR